MAKLWRLAKPTNRPELPSTVPQRALAATLLANRGVTEPEAIAEFLWPEYARHTHDPFLFTQMERVVERLLEAVANRTPVALYGDYDADGVCSTAVLASTLRALGGNVADVYLPHREREGYGLNRNAVDVLVGAGARLIVTLDCGTTNLAEIAFAKTRGVDVIVLDHHHVASATSPAFALLNPKTPGERYPFKHLASVGVAFKTAQALLRRRQLAQPSETAHWEDFEQQLLDYVAIATVTDLVPLQGENRTLLAYGLRALNQTTRPGLRALIARMGGTLGRLDAGSVAYQVGPRLNAAGRMNHANAAYELLVCEDMGRAETLAADLEASNRARQALTERVTTEALATLRGQADDVVRVAVGDGWPVGIVGLVASRLLEQSHRPVLVISRTPQGYLGSGRSIAGFNIIEALHTMPELFLKFGGHAQACGFTLKDEAALVELKQRLNALAEKQLVATDPQPVLNIDAPLTLGDVNTDLEALLQLLAPYGMANPKPKFLFPELRVVGRQTVGATSQHLKLTVSDDAGAIRSAIAFNQAVNAGQATSLGARIDVVAEVFRNDFNGHRDLQLKVADLRPSLPR